jgi:hypothetical protein
MKLTTYLLIGVAAIAALQSWRLASEQRAHANTRTAHAEQRTDWEREARRAIESARTEEQRRYAAQQEIAHAAQKQAAQARADADAADVVARRLRERAATLASELRAARSHLPAPEGSPPAGDPIGVLAHVLGLADQRAGILARFADAAHTAGHACERSYDALTP